MAKVDKKLLKAIGNGSVTHISQADGLPLLQNDPPLIEVNTAMVDDKGNAAVRLSDAGKALVNGASAPANEAKTSPYEIISGAELPPSRRGVGLKGGGAPTQYPFDKLEIGQTFFVPVSAKHPNPVKTLGSTVSSANMRFADKTGEMKTVERAKRGEKGKALRDEAGNKVMETVEVPVHKLTRKFSIRGVEKGKQYGNWTAPDDGALIARVALTD